MLAIDVELLHGIFVGTGSGDLAITGREAKAEWPPSPVRLFSALVAGGGTGDSNRVGSDDAELRALEVLPPPRIRASAPNDVDHHAAIPRFVVIDQTEQRGWEKDKSKDPNPVKIQKPVSFVQNYPAREAQESRGAPTAAPRNHCVSFEWPEAVLDPVHVEALERRAARVGYFGCSDAPVRLRVRTDEGTMSTDRATWIPDPRGTIELSVPSAGLLDMLDGAFADWSTGSARRRSWLSVATAAYGVEGENQVPTRPSWWLAFDRAISARHSIRVAEAVRDALLTVMTRESGSRAVIPPDIHGHVRGTSSTDHLHVAALPFVGRRHADGLIRGAMLMLPAATALDVTADVDAGVQRIGAVWARGRNDNTIFDVNVSPSDRRSPGTVQRGRWERASTDWASVTPVIMELRRKNGPTQSDVGEWLGRHGIDTAFDFRWSPVPILDGGWAYEPFDVFRRVEQRRPYGYLRLRFAEPVRGPLLLGRGRHYGMGLMAPIEVRVDV